MKKLIFVALLFASMAAQASGLSLAGNTLKADFSGVLFATNLDPISLHKLGKPRVSEAGFRFPDAIGINPLSIDTPAGQSISTDVDAGLINFEFFAKNRFGENVFASNGDASLIFSQLSDPQNQQYENLDPLVDDDGFDYILSVLWTKNSGKQIPFMTLGLTLLCTDAACQPDDPSAVPVPGALPLLASVLGLFALARRRMC